MKIEKKFFDGFLLLLLIGFMAFFINYMAKEMQTSTAQNINEINNFAENYADKLINDLEKNYTHSE